MAEKEAPGPQASAMDEVSLSEAALALRAADPDAEEPPRVTGDGPAPPYLRSGAFAPLRTWGPRSRGGWFG